MANVKRKQQAVPADDILPKVPWLVQRRRARRIKARVFFNGLALFVDRGRKGMTALLVRGCSSEPHGPDLDRSGGATEGVDINPNNCEVSFFWVLRGPRGVLHRKPVGGKVRWTRVKKTAPETHAEARAFGWVADLKKLAGADVRVNEELLTGKVGDEIASRIHLAGGEIGTAKLVRDLSREKKREFLPVKFKEQEDDRPERVPHAMAEEVYWEFDHPKALALLVEAVPLSAPLPEDGPSRMYVFPGSADPELVVSNLPVATKRPSASTSMTRKSGSHFKHFFEILEVPGKPTSRPYKGKMPIPWPEDQKSTKLENDGTDYPVPRKEVMWPEQPEICPLGRIDGDG